jgi:hypothetical protein
MCRIPSSATSLEDRQNMQFTQFVACAGEILSEAAAFDLPVGTRADIWVLWRRIKAQLPQTSKEVADAVHHYLGLVRAAPFGTDVLGIYWGTFGLDGVRDDAKALIEETAAQDVAARLPTGYANGFDLEAGSFGRFALVLMRSINDRAELDCSRIAFLLKNNTAHEVMGSMVGVLASCLAHDRMPGYIEFFDGQGESVLQVAAPTWQPTLQV